MICIPFFGGGSFAVDSLFIVAPIVHVFCVWSLLCYVVLCVLSSVAAISR